MDIIVTILAVAFVGLLLATAFTFSLALVVIFSGIVILAMSYSMLVSWWRRWRMVESNRPPRRDITVIEGQYTTVERDKREADNE